MEKKQGKTLNFFTCLNYKIAYEFVQETKTKTNWQPNKALIACYQVS